MKKLIIAALFILPMTMFAQKFGHVNTTTLIQAMPEYTKAMEDMQKMQKELEEEFTHMQSEFQTKYEEYEKNPPTIESIKQRKEQELQELNNRMQQFAQNSQTDLQKAQQEKMAPILKKVQDAIKEVGAAGGYVYIMDTSSGIPFINETISTDVTSQIKTKLGIK